MSLKIGKNCKIHPTAYINVNDGFIGDGTIINEYAKIEGQKIIIGRESFIDRFATIGGGSCFDPQAELIAGDWLHMGVNSHINIARGVYIGHEFGCGIETKIFTHGAYTDSYNLGSPSQWAPVRIGNQVWCPNAWINPGVTIGNQVVVSARSLINNDLPDGCLAGGIPAKILRQDYLKAPDVVTKQKNIQQIILQVKIRHTNHNLNLFKSEVSFDVSTDSILVQKDNQKTLFNLSDKTISGTESEISTLLKDQLRRNGVRFRYEWTDSEWTVWK